jgi:hypothetical protein
MPIKFSKALFGLDFLSDQPRQMFCGLIGSIHGARIQPINGFTLHSAGHSYCLFMAVFGKWGICGRAIFTYGLFWQPVPDQYEFHKLFLKAIQAFQIRKGRRYSSDHGQRRLVTLHTGQQWGMTQSDCPHPKCMENLMTIKGPTFVKVKPGSGVFVQPVEIPDQ